MHHGVGIGGAPISLLNLVKALPKEQYDPIVLFQKNSAVVEFYKKESIKTDVVGWCGSFLVHHKKEFIQWFRFYRYMSIFPHWIINAYFLAPRYLKKYQPDIVHLNSDVLSAWGYAAKKLNIPVVCHVRDPFEMRGYFGIRTRLIRRLLNQSVDKFICISKDNLERLGLPDKSVVVYNTVELPEAYRMPFSSVKPYKVLYLGGMAKIKGYRVVCQALPYINPGIVVQLAGGLDKSLEQLRGLAYVKEIVKRLLRWRDYYLLAKARELHNVEILGLLQEPLKFIDDADILISPFTVEHFARPIIEAFAYGKPVVASNIVGMAEIVDSERNGLLVDITDPKSLAQAINKLAANPSLSVAYGAEGRRKAEKLFSMDRNVLAVQLEYEDLLKKP